MQTDPNWSNFLYDETTRSINLIDFGAARDYPKGFVDDYLQMVNFLYLVLMLHIRTHSWHLNVFMMFLLI